MANSIVTLQSMFDYQSIKDAFPNADERAINDYSAKGREILRSLRESAPEQGSGSPEGVVTSTLSRLYVDTDIPQLYFNPSLGSNTGWVAI